MCGFGMAWPSALYGLTSLCGRKYSLCLCSDSWVFKRIQVHTLGAAAEQNGTRTECLPDSKLDSNTLIAQFSSCSVFSRKEMKKLFKSVRFYTKPVLNSWKRSTSLLVLRRKQNLGAEQK